MIKRFALLTTALAVLVSFATAAIASGRNSRHRHGVVRTRLTSDTRPDSAYRGHVFRGNPQDIPLTKHTQITLDVRRPLIAPVAITFPAGL